MIATRIINRSTLYTPRIENNYNIAEADGSIRRNDFG